MSTIIIENLNNEKTIALLCRHYPEAQVVAVDPSEKETIFDIAHRINDKADKNNLLLVNAALKITGCHAGEWGGLQIIEEFRAMRHFFDQANKVQLSPVLLYSHFSEDILRQDEMANAILDMPGISYIQIFLLSDALPQKIDQLVPVASIDSYKSYYSNVLQVPSDEQHAFTNLHAFIQALEDTYRLKPAPILKDWWMQVQRIKFKALRNEQFLSSLEVKKGQKQQRQLPILKKQLETLRQHFLDPSRRINLLLIDDQAGSIHPSLKIGWKDFYSFLLFDQTRKIKTISPDRPIEEILEVIANGVDCLILDYYLMKEDYHQFIEESKAGKILKAVKSWNPLFPVLMATASNKAWSKDEFEQMGCDAYLTKPEPRFRHSSTSSLEKMLDFSGEICKLTSRDYSLLMRSIDLVKEMYHQKMWWENYNWNDKSTGNTSCIQIRINKQKLLGAIEAILIEIRDYFRESSLVLNRHGVSKDLSVIIVGSVLKLTDWVEKFHGSPRRNVTKILENHLDFLGAALYKIRNKSAHNQSNHTYDFPFIAQFVKGFLSYLWLSPEVINKVLGDYQYRNGIEQFLVPGSKMKRLDTYFNGHLKWSEL